MNCRSLLALALYAILAGSTFAQSISPISEDFGHGKANGDLTITNNGLRPMSATLSLTQFFVRDGHKVSAALTDDISVKLSAYSLKIPPKQSRIVSYNIKCLAGCNVEVGADLGSPGMRTPSGMLIVLHLGSLAYVAPAKESGKNRRQHVLLTGGVQP